MSNLVFPSSLPGLTLTVNRQPEYATGILASGSGKEYRASWQTRPRTRYSLTFEFLRSDAYVEWQKLVGFFQRHQGAFDSFLFTDPDDNLIPDSAPMAFGKGDGSTLAFQLQRSLVASADYSSPVIYYPGIGDGFEPITDLNGVPKIYVAGVLQVSGYAIANGIVTFVSPPANLAALTWSGAYYKRVRFSNDVLATQRIVVSIWDATSVELIQVI